MSKLKTIAALLATVFASPAPAQTTLAEPLSAIENVLLEERPDFVATLRPPLIAAQITALEAEYSITLPNEVKALYMWHDGQDPQGFDTFVNNMQFQPLQDALSVKAELDGMIGYNFTLQNWWNPAWLPLFHNGGGDYLVVDTAGIHTGDKGQLLMVYHDWEHRPIIAPNLTVFAQAVLSFYVETPIEDMNEFYFIDDYLNVEDQYFWASGDAVLSD